MFRIVICDDDLIYLQKIERCVKEYVEEKKIRSTIHTYQRGEDISTHILKSCDIAILDVDLNSPDVNGMDIARKLRTLRTDSVIVFVTNYIEYAPEGYEVKAFRYVLKKTIKEDLEHYLDLAFSQFSMAQEIFKIQINGELIDIPLERILYFSVEQHAIYIHCKSNSFEKHKIYQFYDSLTMVETKLESKGFLRIHKSYLVNMRYLKIYNVRQATLVDGTELRVGEKRYAQQKEKYLLWKGWH